jgi:hypothetical protein
MQFKNNVPFIKEKKGWKSAGSVSPAEELQQTYPTMGANISGLLRKTAVWRYPFFKRIF